MNSKKITAIIFFAIVLIIPLVTFIMPKQDFSQMENRTLATFPKFSFSTLKDRQFMNGFDNFFLDHFVLRDNWISTKGNIEHITGQKESNDVFVCDDKLIRRINEPDIDSVKRTVDAVKSFGEKNNITPFVMIVPSAAEIQEEFLPSNASSTVWDQQKLITDINKWFGSSAIPIDVYKCLYEKKNENIFYKTDHHWTTEGAYYAYVEAGKSLGYQGLNHDLFSIENASTDFYGTLYSRSAYRNIQPDIIKIYSSDIIDKIEKYTVFDGKAETEYDSLYFREYLDTKDQYALFLGPNQAITTIETTKMSEYNRSDVNKEKNILIFKDSYAQAFVPFLTHAYNKITLVDLRYLNTSFEDYIDLDEYGQVMLLYSIDTFANTTDLTKIDW